MRTSDFVSTCMYLSVFGFFLHLCYQNPPLSTPHPSYQVQRWVLPSSDLWNQIHDFFSIFFSFHIWSCWNFPGRFYSRPSASSPLLRLWLQTFVLLILASWFFRLLQEKEQKIKVSLHECTCECLPKAARARGWKSLVVDLALPRFITAHSTCACVWRCITLSASEQEVFNNLWKIIKSLEEVRGVV